MTIQLTLPPATEDRLRAAAEAADTDAGTFVVEAVEARLSLAKRSFRKALGPVHEDLHRSGMTDAELDRLLQETLTETRGGAEALTRPGRMIAAHALAAEEVEVAFDRIVRLDERRDGSFRMLAEVPSGRRVWVVWRYDRDPDEVSEVFGDSEDAPIFVVTAY